MDESIKWETNLQVALGRARKVDLPVFLFIMNPPCPSCRQMDTATYQNPKAIDFIMGNVVPLRVVAPESPDLAKEFNLKRTPMWLILCADGKEHYRALGFFDSDDLVAAILLGIAKTRFDQERFTAALAILDRLFAEYPANDVIPEAIFLRGGARFKQTRDRCHLRESYERLLAEHPSSSWTKRALPYGTIQA
jgi:tetratricopeptide (TPR) repeat protein